MQTARLRFLPLASLVLLALCLSGGAQPTVARAVPAHQQDRIGPVDASLRLLVPGHVPAWQSRATDLGTLPDAETVPLNFALTRAPQIQAAFDQLLRDQQDPTSTRYHQWLTPQQVGDQYGPTQHDLDALTTWLTGQGFTVTGITPSRVVVQATASSAVISAALGTTVHSYSLAGHNSAVGEPERLRAPLNEPVLPAALAPLVYYIGGLIDVPVTTHSVQIERIALASTSLAQSQKPQSQMQGQPAAALPEFSLGAGGTVHLLAPADFNLIYGVTPAISAGTTGAGVKVMVIGGSRLLASDLSAWETLANLPAYQPNYIIGPGFLDPGVTSDGNQGEGTLDFERVYGTAPGATVDHVIAKDWLSGTVNANLELYAIGTVNDPIMTMSYSSCEYLQGTSYVNYESNSIFAPGAAQGISFFASSGDSNVTTCAPAGAAPSATTYGGVASISDLCASPYVTCVGGTQFSDTAAPSTFWSTTNGPGELSALSYIPEGAWNEPVNNGSNAATLPFRVLGTGGGPSTIIAKPYWQVGNGVPADGVRDTPDISFSASGHNAYFSCLAYAGADCSKYLTGFSGTSASAPSMAGIAALINQKLGGRQGNLNPLLYKLFASNNAVFNDPRPASSGVSPCDLTTASTCNTTNPTATSLTGGFEGYPLQAGYDFPTGLGSLNVSAFLNAAAAASNTSTTATTTALTATPATITTAGSVVFTATVMPVAGGAVPTGNIVFSTSTGTGLGTVALVNGQALTGSLTFPAAGTYTIGAVYSGDSLNAASTATVTLVVTPSLLAPSSIILGGTAGNVTTQDTVSYTATFAGSAAGTAIQTGTVAFVRTSGSTTATLGQAVIAAGKASFTGSAPPAGSYTVAAVYAGDTHFSGSTSNTLNLTVNTIPTLLSIVGVPPTVTSTTPITPTVSLASGTHIGTPGGSVQFYVDGVARGAAVLIAGASATGPTVFVPAGHHTVGATYAGDSVFAGAFAGNVLVTSTLTSTATTLNPLAITLPSYQTQTFTATISGLSASVPTGATVTFRDGANSLSTGPLTFANGVGTATYAAGPLSAGTHALTATFNGDSSYAGSASNAVALTVTAATITLTPAQTALTTSAGTPVTDIATLVSTNFTGNQTVTCSVAASNFTATNTPVCSFGAAGASTTLTFTGNSSSSTTVTLSSLKASVRTSTAAANHGLIGTGGSGWTKGAGIMSFAGLLAFCLPRAWAKRRQSLHLFACSISYSKTCSLLIFAFLLITLAGLTGCGGGANSFTSPPVAGTTAGVYTVTLKTTDSTGFVANTVSFQLTVQ